MAKVWQLKATDTLESICNSVARKAGRGMLQVDEPIIATFNAHSPLADGREFLAHIEISCTVKILREIVPIQVKSVEPSDTTGPVVPSRNRPVWPGTGD